VIRIAVIDNSKVSLGNGLAGPKPLANSFRHVLPGVAHRKEKPSVIDTALSMDPLSSLDHWPDHPQDTIQHVGVKDLKRVAARAAARGAEMLKPFNPSLPVDHPLQAALPPDAGGPVGLVDE